MPGVPCDVLEVAPATGGRYMLTSGLSGFILDEPRDGERHEIFLVPPLDLSSESCAPLLRAIAEIALERRCAFFDGEVIEDERLAGPLPAGATAHLAAIRFGLWLSKADAEVKSHYPLTIAEVLLLTRHEAEQIRSDESAFEAMWDRGEIDYLNVFRQVNLTMC